MTAGNVNSQLLRIYQCYQSDMVWLGIEEIRLLFLKENKIFNAASLRLVSSVSVCVCNVTNKTIFNAENRSKFN